MRIQNVVEQFGAKTLIHDETKMVGQFVRAIHESAEIGRCDILNYLISKGLPNFLSKNENFEFGEIFFSANRFSGWDLGIRSDRGAHAIHFAAYRNQFKLIELLVKKYHVSTEVCWHKKKSLRNFILLCCFSRHVQQKQVVHH